MISHCSKCENTEIECKGMCRSCYKREYYLARAEKIKARLRQRRKDNPEHFKALDAKKYKNRLLPKQPKGPSKWDDPAFVKEYSKQHHQRYKHKRKKPIQTEARRAQIRAHYHKNRDEIIKKRKLPEKRAQKHHSNRLRELSKINATPSWVDLEALKKIYMNRPFNMEIDHIIPLRGKEVCGLHVPWNLQYLTPEQNRKKSNKILP